MQRSRVYRLLSHRTHTTDINPHLQSAGTYGRGRGRGFKLRLCLFAKLLGDGAMMNNKWVSRQLLVFRQLVEFYSQLFDGALGIDKYQIRRACEVSDDILGDLVKFIILGHIGIL